MRRPETAERVALACGLEPGDAVIEIGPGLGALTRHLRPRARRCLAIEIDSGIVQALRADPEFADLELVHSDVLQVDLAARARELGAPVVLVGNLPYSISGRLLGQLLLDPNPFRRWVFMLQSEVGERLLAGPDTPAYGPLAVFAAHSVRVRRALELGPDEFVPRPRVRSSLLTFDPLPGAPALAAPEALRRVVRRLFQQRRKTLARVLRDWLGPPGAQILGELGWDPRSRAETLAPAQFSQLCEAILRVPGTQLTLDLTET